MLGDMRGPTEDGGWFYSYTRRFTSLGLQGILAFSGNELPEQNRKAALKSLYFERIGGDRFADSRIELEYVPAVLRSEAWSDLQSIAAEDSGFDAAVGEEGCLMLVPLQP